MPSATDAIVDAAAGTRSALAALRRVLAELADGGIREFLGGQFERRHGAVAASAASVPELQKFLQSEIVRWGKVVDAAGLAHSE